MTYQEFRRELDGLSGLTPTSLNSKGWEAEVWWFSEVGVRVISKHGCIKVELDSLFEFESVEFDPLDYEAIAAWITAIVRTNV
jgi:hypothetical protein